MEHTTNKSDAPTDPLSGATPANRRTRHIRGALAATTSVGMLFGAGTAVAGASSATASGTHKAPHTRAAFRHDDVAQRRDGHQRRRHEHDRDLRHRQRIGRHRREHVQGGDPYV